jgi:hypothetical protein
MALKAKKLIVTEEPSFERDAHSNAIINTDKAAYEHAVLRKKKYKEEQERIASLESAIESLNSRCEALESIINKL